MGSFTTHDEVSGNYAHNSFHQETTMHEVFYRDNGKWKYETSNATIKDYNKKTSKGLDQLLKLALIMHPRGNTITIPGFSGVTRVNYVKDGKLKKLSMK
jgi:hypothetical protein